MNIGLNVDSIKRTVSDNLKNVTNVKLKLKARLTFKGEVSVVNDVIPILTESFKGSVSDSPLHEIMQDCIAFWLIEMRNAGYCIDCFPIFENESKGVVKIVDMVYRLAEEKEF